MVKVGAGPLYTTTLRPGETLSFTLIPDTTAIYTFTAVWGSYSGTANITPDGTIGEKQPDNSTEPAGPPAEDTNATSSALQDETTAPQETTGTSSAPQDETA